MKHLRTTRRSWMAMGSIRSSRHRVSWLWRSLGVETPEAWATVCLPASLPPIVPWLTPPGLVTSRVAPPTPPAQARDET